MWKGTRHCFATAGIGHTVSCFVAQLYESMPQCAHSAFGMIAFCQVTEGHLWTEQGDNKASSDGGPQTSLNILTQLNSRPTTLLSQCMSAYHPSQNQSKGPEEGGGACTLGAA